MSRRKFGDIDALLHDLIDRHEANPAVVRILAYMDEDAFASVEARDRFTAGLFGAEKAGGISVQRKRVDGAMVQGHVRLADPPALYAYLGRVPARAQVDAALHAAKQRQDLPTAGRSLLDEIAEAWSRGVSRYGLVPHDDVGLASSLDLVQALARRASDLNAVPTDFRTFSRLAGSDSKALERLTATVIGVFRRLYPAIEMPAGFDADDLLATFGIVRTPQPLTLSGPLCVATMELPPLSYYGFPPEQGDAIGLAARVDYVLTIENYTSFVRHVREVNDDKSGLVIYTGGFPSRAHLRQIVRLAELSQAPVYHWGDLDGGGVRIFCHLERALLQRACVLFPHLMTPDLLEQHGVVASKQLRTADAPSSDSAMRKTWDALIEIGLVLEQESLSPRRPAIG